MNDIILRNDNEKNTLIAEYEIIGEADYYVDLYCNNEKLTDKVKISNTGFEIKCEIPSGIYEIIIFEQEVNDFNGIYKQIYTTKKKIINPYNLEGQKIHIKGIHKISADIFIMTLRYDYEISIDEKINNIENQYIGTLTISDGRNKNAFPKRIVITVIDANNLRNLDIKFIDMYNNEPNLESFLYNNEDHVLIENEDKHMSATKIYRVYEYIVDDAYYYEVNYDGK